MEIEWGALKQDISDVDPVYEQKLKEQAQMLGITEYLGRFCTEGIRLASIYGSLPENVHAATLIMCGDHGIARHGVSVFPQEVTLQMMASYAEGTAAANVLSRHAMAEVIVVDCGVKVDTSHLANVMQLKVAPQTEDFTVGPAMTRSEAEAGIQAGMEAVRRTTKRGFNILLTGEMGIANTTVTAALTSALLGLSPEETVGRGSGLNDERLEVKREVVAQGLKVNNVGASDALDILAKVGGYEHAGLVGMIIEAAREKVPVILDGVNTTIAAVLACALIPQCCSYLFASHLSTENAHSKMLEALKLTPLVDAGMHLGEGTGAALALGVVRDALAVLRGLGLK